MNMFEEAEALSAMIKMCSVSQSEMAKKLGVSQSYVANKLRLLSYDRGTRDEILEAGLTERHARALLKLHGQKEFFTALKKISSDKLNVEKSEALIDYLWNGTLPERICGRDKLDAVEHFKTSVKRSVSSLVSLGVDANISSSYYGNKSYITIAIDEGW